MSRMDCAAFSVLFPEIIFFKDASEFSTTTKSYFAAFENELEPACVVQPRNAAELGQVVSYLSMLSAAPRVAVKGGGHTAWAGAANIADGVLIDLRNFKGVTVHEDTGVASIGAGERWGDVYESLAPRGLAVSGGRVSKVGVSGLILGGGLSMFCETHGFVCDQVVNFEVVLASGDVVQANNTTHADLFQALKGGSNNFGIVTKFDLPAFHQGQMWGGLLLHTASAWPAVVDNYLAWTNAPDKHGTLIIARFYSAAMDGVCACVYSVSTAQVSPTLKDFTSFQPPLMNTVREDSLLGFAREQAQFSTDGARQLFFTTSCRNSKAVLLNAVQLFEHRLEELKAIPGFSLSLTLQPLTQQMLAVSAKQGGNALGLSPEDGPIVIVLLNSVHADKADDEKVVEKMQDMLRAIEELSVREGVEARYRFMNYAYEGTKVLESYGEESVKELRAASEKYDPKGFFQKAVPGGFKVSSVA